VAGRSDPPAEGHVSRVGSRNTDYFALDSSSSITETNVS
jgi:hypothetical protein